MTQIESKNRQTISGKKDQAYSVSHFTLVLTTASQRNTKKQREKSWQDLSVNLSENITTITDTMTYL